MTYHENLYKGMLASLCEQARQHNAKYPKPAYRASYPARFKKGDMNTAHNIAKAWAKQAARQINSGAGFITNRVSTNNVDAQGAMPGDQSNTAKYLGKLALAGFIVGEQVGDTAEARYRCQFTQQGRGFGVRPVKNFHGTARNYELLLSPALVPLGCLPAGVSFVALTDFQGTEAPDFCRPAEASASLYMRESFTLSIGKTEPENKKIPSAETSAGSQSLPGSGTLSEDEEADGKRKELAQAGLETKSEDEKNSGGPRGGAFSRRLRERLGAAASAAPVAPAVRMPSGREIGHDAVSQGIFSRLFLAGHQLAAFAVLLVQSYLKNIAPVTGREYVPAEIERGVVSAMALLQLTPEDQRSERVDEYIHTIDCIAEWARRKPGGWVLPPGTWFKPGAPGNIQGAEKRFYRPYIEQAATWRDAQAVADKVADARQQADEQAATKSSAHEVAALLKRHMMHLHPTDGRLRTANLDAWAAALRMAMRREKGLTAGQMKEIAVWLFQSDSKQAAFWRSEVGGTGLRSATGFLRHFQKLHHQFHKK